MDKIDKIEQLLTRGVENIYPLRGALEKILRSGKKLRIYLGIDPTGKLHLGHGVILNKLRQFQDLGHKVIVLIGDFTARIGDPTDKLSSRKKLSKEQVKKNSADYKKLIGKILDLKKSNIKFLYNEKWTNKLKPEDMLELASYFTVSRLLERDMFQERIKQGKEIYINEFLYPIFQAYDAVTMDVDLQIGGNDQTFNMLAGRTLIRKIKNKEKFVLTTKLLTDPSGKKMGKSEDNMVNLDENPDIMYGKIMSWPDTLIDEGFELCTRMPIKEVIDIRNKLKNNKLNPRDAKMRLAYEIVKFYHSEKKAGEAQENFIKLFQKKEIIEEIPRIKAKKGAKLSDVLIENKIISSRTEFRRLVRAKAIDINGKVFEGVCYSIEKTIVVRIGKKKFARIVF
jgi:tyrosyl-tRNA synthetase